MKKTFAVLTPSNVTIDVPDPILQINETITPIDPGPTPINKPPVARAGADQVVIMPAAATFGAVVLDGSASTDPENKIKTYGWRRISGPACLIKTTNAAITTVDNMVEGQYRFELRVADDKDLFSVDYINVTVRKDIVPPPPPPPINKPPLANAGNDQTVLLPLSEINLDGSLSYDPDGQIKSYLWKQISGPTATLSDVTKAVISVKDLVEGVYTFQLEVTDNNDSVTGDRVTITVKKQVVDPPTGATYPFTLTQNKSLVKLRHFGGFENWNGQNFATFAGGWKDYYFRFTITDVLKGANATYDWSRFDREAQKAVVQGAGFAIGFMPFCDSDGFLAKENYDGAVSSYPLAWHNQMQSEGVKDFKGNGQWIPNWNSPSFLNNLAAFFKRVNEHIDTTSFNGVKYKDVMNYIDIRVYAQWGEWHNGGLFDNVSQFPAGTRPTVATYKRIIDMHCDAFPNYPLVILFAAYDANWLPHTMTPPEVTYYALTKRNNWGLIGFRRDQWGTDDNYVHDYLEKNTRSFGSSGPFNQIIMERWKYAPIVGEPYGPGANLSKLKDQVIFYHATSVGNGNQPNETNSLNLFKAAVDQAGAKLSLNKGQLKVSTEFDFDITMTVENFGIGPVYNDRLNIVYELKNSSGNVAWTSTSVWKPILKIPGTYAISDHYKVTTVPPGTYSLSAVIKDNYRALPLFNDNQKTDGSITLHSAIKM